MPEQAEDNYRFLNWFLVRHDVILKRIKGEKIILNVTIYANLCLCF
jgi:hypothetical protein